MFTWYDSFSLRLFRRGVSLGYFLVGVVDRSKEHVVVETEQVLPCCMQFRLRCEQGHFGSFPGHRRNRQELLGREQPVHGATAEGRAIDLPAMTCTSRLGVPATVAEDLRTQ
jgi:hypothetical protein